MSGKKSALTAALAGGTPIPSVPTSKASSLGNLQAFPCLLQGEDGANAGAIEFSDPHHTAVVGSLPTNTSLPSGKQLVGYIPRSHLLTCNCMEQSALIWAFWLQADYPLDPYRRRGGKECLSSSLRIASSAGIVSSTALVARRAAEQCSGACSRCYHRRNHFDALGSLGKAYQAPSFTSATAGSTLSKRLQHHLILQVSPHHHVPILPDTDIHVV
jgi:hypothetical protein